ncbi:amino acid adenylation domain-containing protein, partial [Nocardia niigatensis]
MDTTRRSVRGSRRRRSGSPFFGQLLTAAVESADDAVAISFNPTGNPSDLRELTYRELDEQSSRVARELIALGIGPGDVVAMGIARSVESVLAMWAIVKTGATYLPVDPTYPGDRIEHMLTDSGAKYGVTLATHRAGLGTAAYWIELDDPARAERIAARPAHPISYADRTRPLTEQHLAYVIYTSGSTGKPKGVAITHSGLAGLAARRESRSVTEDSRITQLTTPSFDFSIVEMLYAFTAGATLVVVPPDVFGGQELSELLRRERVTHICITPAVLESLDPAVPQDLRAIMCGGERVPPALVDRWITPDRDFHIEYGPTEVTALSTGTAALPPGGGTHIGTLLPGIGAYVLDAGLRPVPPGVVGELYLAGPALAAGYLNRPVLTAERFVASPYGEPGQRLYRTGDLVKRLENGNFEHHGRTDFQVKIRGLRIELGEIDSALTAHPGVDFAVTLGTTLPTGAAALVTYVLPSPGTVLDTAELAAFAGESLPAYMVPAAIMVLDEIPLTPVGKVDRARLPEPVFTTRAFRAPATAAEAAVAEVFSGLLTPPGAEPLRVGSDDDFFELGGNSLLATQAVARIGTALGLRVPVRVLFEASTVTDLAGLLAGETTGNTTPALVSGPRPDRVPLSYAQQRMWFLNRFAPDSAVDNVPLAVRLSGELDLDAMRAAVRDLVERHEVLRTVYPEVDGEGYQQVLPLTDPRAIPDLRVDDIDAAELATRVMELGGAGFDVTATPPLRLRVLRLGPGEQVLVAVVHHIAADGFSMGPLTRDLVTAYVSRSSGTAPHWAPLPVQYADYTLWQRTALGAEDDESSALARQIAFWRETLSELPDELVLPSDRPRPPVASYRGGTYRFELAGDVYAAVRRLARGHNGTTFMVVHTALAVLLAQLSGTRDIAIGTPVAGRGEAELDDLIGMFVNTLVLRTDVDPATGFADLLDRVRDADVRAFGHADVPFERLVDLLDPARSQARNPLFQVMLSFQNLAPAEFRLPGLTVSGTDLEVPFAKFDLQLTVQETVDERGDGTGMAAEFSYALDLFDEPTVASFARRFARVLELVAADPMAPVGDLDLLAPEERRRVLTDWNATGFDVIAAAGLPNGIAPTLISMFEAQAADSPDAVALVFEDERLTYRELSERARRLARELIDGYGVGPETSVGLAIRRSTELVVAMYAVLMTGAAYLPLDPEQPLDRNEHILATAGPRLVLTTWRDGFGSGSGVPALFVEEAEERARTRWPSGPLAAAERTRPLRPGHPAYIIFTSGSTGRPKGVAVSHAAIVNRLVWMQAQYRLTYTDVVLQKTPATFDVSVWEFFWPLQTGARLVVAKP